MYVQFLSFEYVLLTNTSFITIIFFITHAEVKYDATGPIPRQRSHTSIHTDGISFHQQQELVAATSDVCTVSPFLLDMITEAQIHIASQR